MTDHDRPLIGIGSWLEHARWERFQDRVAFVELSFLEKLDAAGAATTILPPEAHRSARLLDCLDAVLLAGGPDLFSEEDVLRPPRDRADLGLARWALESSAPVLGVCRGCQVLNVAAGGTLIPEIEGRFAGVRHQLNRPDDTRPFEFAHHEVEAEEGSMVARILGARFDVLSSHHQAVAEPAPGFVVAARSSDGLIEAISAEAHPFALGVQWHPESGPDDSLFRALVEAAEQHMKKARTSSGASTQR